MAVALIEHQAGGLSFELGRKGATLLGHQTPLYGEHSRPKWVSGISRPLHLWRLASQGIFAAQQSLLDRPIAQLDFPALTVEVDDLPTRKAQRVDHRSQYA